MSNLRNSGRNVSIQEKIYLIKCSCARLPGSDKGGEINRLH